MINIGRLIAVILAIVLVVGATLFLFFRSPVASEGLYKVMTAAGVDTAAPERHVVPENFEGWVVVHYGVDGAPELRHEDGAVIIEYPATGRLDTSSPAPDAEGFIQRGYYRRTPDGLEPLSRAGDIWGEFSHRTFRGDHAELADRMSQGDHAEGAGRSSGFYVGTLAGFRATGWPKDHREPIGPQEP